MGHSWFTEEIEYSGVGRAEFRDPTATLIGPASATLDASGEMTIRFEAQAVSSNEPTPFGVMSVIQGNRMHGDDGKRLGFGLKDNPCLSFSIQTDAGSLEVDQPVMTSWTMSSASSATPIIISPHTATFVARRSQARYWVLPLMNLSSAFWRAKIPPDEILTHPLRMCESQSLPEGGSDVLRALVLAETRGRVLWFRHRNHPVFIEPLRAFESRLRELRQKERDRVITAVMIGEVSPRADGNEGALSSPPYHLLPVLGLASESAVGAPWVEFRDDAGNLVRRLHRSSWIEGYRKGTVFIDGSFHRGLDELLTTCSDGGGEAYSGAVRDALRLLTAACKLKVNLEDNLVGLFRAFDGLWSYFDEVQGDPRLSTMTPKTVKGGQGFGQRVTGLLDYLGLADACVCERAFREDPGILPSGDNDGTWAGFVSQVRGRVMHGVFSHSGISKQDFKQAGDLENHFIDLLARVVLRMLNFQGTYQSRLVPYADRRGIDWVTQDTRIEELGYESDIEEWEAEDA